MLVVLVLIVELLTGEELAVVEVLVEQVRTELYHQVVLVVLDLHLQ
tara:strand:- start:342 stop:479 length:138 start_codon:yes stop_codon:yes gene_type:complete